MAYDVFISYRRETGADDARLLQQALMARGFNVFFDYDSLRDGKFDEKIFEAIDEAPVFVLMLTERALDRCLEDGDWVRLEIERALVGNKHIVPVVPSSQHWVFPDRLPASLKGIPFEQASELNKASLFVRSVDQIVEDRFPEALRRKCRSTESLFSTVSFGSTVFVGRDAEMARLHELLVAGKFPVITGPGGTGKSELALQYAAQYQAEYPGGLFQVDMETVSSWEYALTNRLLNPRSAPGADVCSFLGLRTDDVRNGEKWNTGVKMDVIGADDVIEALNRRAQQNGCALIVLDNVEFVKDLLREQVMVKLRLHSNIRVIATARSVDVTFPKTARCVEFPLSDISTESGLQLLLEDRPASSDAEHKAAASIVELLGRRALYLRAVPSLLDNPGSPFAASYQKLEGALRRNLLGTISSGVSEFDGKNRTPTTLWGLTREALLSRPSGREMVKLAEVASLLSPNGFPEHILRHLWDSIISPPQQGDFSFSQAIEVFSNYNLLHMSGGVLRMHRLMRVAIQSVDSQAVADIEDEVGRDLASYLGTAPRDWLLFADNAKILSHLSRTELDVHLGERCLRIGWSLRRTRLLTRQRHAYLWTELLMENEKATDYHPWERLDGSDWVLLLSRCPQFADKCEWDKLTGANWAELLRSQPQFEKMCPWHLLDAMSWVTLLSAQPHFSANCPWTMLQGSDWARLLGRQPQFANLCAWNKFDGNDWVILLAEQWQFSARCDWKSIKASGWMILLEKHPELSGKCPWAGLENLPPSAWCQLLKAQPMFADKCKWEIFSGQEWALLLEDAPQFIDKCPLEMLGAGDWVFLLSHHPGLLDKCPKSRLSGYSWATLLSSRPSFAERCEWNKLTGHDWVQLLFERPQFYEVCQWEKLTGDDWVELLCEQPKFASVCAWQTLDGEDWVDLLVVHPEFAEYCSWDLLKGADWVALLSECPQFSDRCAWDKLDGDDWVTLLGKRPEYGEMCAWEKILARKLRTPRNIGDYCHRGEFGGSFGADWIRLLCDQPVFATRCPWPWEKVSRNNWVRLLVSQPQFSDHCPWGIFNGEAWAALLSEKPQFDVKCSWEKLRGSDWTVLLRHQPQFADKCSWRLLDGENWACLLAERPQFANKCCWNRLEGRNWVWLLKYSPQFARHCDLKKIDGSDWADLLNDSPQFADQCPWHKLKGCDWASLFINGFRTYQFANKCPWHILEGSDWVHLLWFEPQFAKHCDWEKLNGSDWVALLMRQPRFADKCSWDLLESSDWAGLITEQPRFCGICRWEKLEVDDWAEIVARLYCYRASRYEYEDITNFLKMCPWEMCPWERFSGRNWVRLLDAGLSDKCQWDKLQGEDWIHLLTNHPQYAERCPWEKLKDTGGQGWAYLLERCPQFADKCPWDRLERKDLMRILLYTHDEVLENFPWERLDGGVWAWLLWERPELADWCAWEKIGSAQWGRLLSRQPQFLDRCPTGKVLEMVLDKLIFCLPKECTWKMIWSWLREKLRHRHNAQGR